MVRVRVLFLDQGMLKDRKGKPIHGIELFRFHLIKQLMAGGVDVTVAFDGSWKKAVGEYFGDSPPKCVWTPKLKGTVTNAVWAVLAARTGGKYDVVSFGNIGRGILPAMSLARGVGLGKRYLGFVHRKVQDRVARSIAKGGFPVIAVSEHVAEPLRRANVERLSVTYGLPNASLFYPRSNGSVGRGDGVIRFGLIARLPNSYKGWERAIACFERLPDELREKCELHLASFIRPYDAEKRGVVCHDWLRSEQVPELLRDMDVLLALSSNETFSQAIVQGMLTALPVVATPLDVYVEKMDTGGGFVCETDDEIVDAMTRLASDASLRAEMGGIAMRTAQERYEWRTEEFIRTFLEQGEVQGSATG